MSMDVQGTTLFFIDPAAPTVVVEVACIRSFSGLSAAREESEETCLKDKARRYSAGMVNPGTASFLVNFDPAEPSHVLLHELFKAGTTVPWALAGSDGTVDPTAVDGEFVLPTSRTWWTFDGYVSDFPFEFSIGQKVQSTLAIRTSGFPELTAKV